MDKVKSLLNKLYNLIYPRYCLHCDTPIGTVGWCEDCYRKVRRIGGSDHGERTRPIGADEHIPDISDSNTVFIKGNDPCQSTATIGSGQFTPRVVAPFYYEGPLATAIQKFKYNKQTYLADFFVELIGDDLASIEVDLVIAIPLHPNRLRSREFNQSLLLARKIADLIACPYLIDALIRTRETRPQVGLSRKEREENVKGAFHVPRPNEVKNQRLLLVDDVYTTGNTLKEGAKALMQAGAKEVVVMTIARMMQNLFFCLVINLPSFYGLRENTVQWPLESSYVVHHLERH